MNLLHLKESYQYNSPKFRLLHGRFFNLAEQETGQEFKFMQNKVPGFSRDQLWFPIPLQAGEVNSSLLQKDFKYISEGYFQ